MRKGIVGLIAFSKGFRPHVELLVAMQAMRPRL